MTVWSFARDCVTLRRDLGCLPNHMLGSFAPRGTQYSSLIGRVPKCPRTLLLRAWYIINAKLLLFSLIVVTASVGEERRFQDPVPAAPASVNISSSPRTSYLDQRRSPASVTVQMEEKNQPPSASSLYESRFRGRTVTWFVLFSGERKREAGTKFESRRIFSRPPVCRLVFELFNGRLFYCFIFAVKHEQKYLMDYKTRYSQVLLLLSRSLSGCHKILMMLVRRICYWVNKSLIDSFRYSHHFSAW